MKALELYLLGMKDANRIIAIHGWDEAAYYYEMHMDTDSDKWNSEYAEGFMNALDNAA